MVEDAYLTAPEGPLAADVRLNRAWPWVAVILGAGLIAVGGFLFSPSTHDQPAASTSWSPR